MDNGIPTSEQFLEELESMGPRLVAAYHDLEERRREAIEIHRENLNRFAAEMARLRRLMKAVGVSESPRATEAPRTRNRNGSQRQTDPKGGGYYTESALRTVKDGIEELTRERAKRGESVVLKPRDLLARRIGNKASLYRILDDLCQRGDLEDVSEKRNQRLFKLADV